MPLLEDVRALGPRIRELASEIESARQLDPELAATFAELGVWRMAVPSAAGGSQLALREIVNVIEELSYQDGSVGWCAMIGGTSGLLYAHLDPDVASKLFSTAPCICGVVAPGGRGTKVEGGIQLSGRWAFGSGVDGADLMGLGTLIETDGGPTFRMAIVPKTAYEIVDTWYVSGLRGTGSKDVLVDDIFVPDEHLCTLATPVDKGALYVFPLFGLLALGVASVCLGIARRAVDELRELAAEKRPTGSRRRLAERSATQVDFARAMAELFAARTFMDSAITDAWERVEAGAEPSIDDRVKLRLAATHAARTSATVVDLMYEAGGATSIYASSPLQRCFRDVHTATQHLVVSPATYELAGRVLLGIETEVAQL